MCRPTTTALFVILAACQARISGAPAELPIDSAAADSELPLPIDGPPPITLGPWSAPAKISSASTGASEEDITMSSDTLELFFAINPTDPNDTTGRHLFYSSRPTVDGEWSKPLKLPFNSTTHSDESPRLSADDKTLYFASGRAGNGNLDVYRVRRDAPGSITWGDAEPVREVNTDSLTEKWFSPCQDGRYVMVQGPADGPTHLVEGVLGGPAAEPITAVNSSNASDTGAFVTADCTTLYLASTRSGNSRLYRAVRASADVAFSVRPSRVTDFADLGGEQEDPWISPDGRTFAFVSNPDGDKDVFIATRSPVVTAR